ncbi:tetratricopeptide repeat protein, partial [Crossiella equi]
LYVNLRGYSTSPPMSPTEALARLLRGLGVRPEHVPADLAEQQALYHKALTGRRVLVVLDNTAGAAEVRPLLPTAPGTAALVTSRDRLRALAVPVLDVDVLPEADAVVLLGDVLGNELVHREPAAALELAALCARLPLALRIAGANFAGRPHASLGRYVTDLRAGNRLDALAVEGDSEAAVHAAFELSYRALPVPAQRLFRLLGLLPGADVGTGLVAVAAGLSEEDTWELLEVLLAANLVQSENGRWSCHDLLREYSVATAEDEDSPADRATALRRVYDHLADHAPSLVDTERPVLLAAAVSAAGHGLLEHSWRIATGMHDYFSARGTAAEAVAAAEAALAAAVRAGAPEAQARVHVLLGELHTRLGALRKGAEHQQSALRLSARLGDVPGEAAALDNLALIHWRLGEPAAARGYATRALALFRQVGDRRGEATALNNLGAVAQQDTRYADAIEHHERALSLGHPEARMMLGVALSSVGRQPEALAHLLEALARARAEGNRVSEAAVLSCVAAVHRDSGELAEAGRTAEQAVAVARELGDRRIEVNGLNIIALVHRRTGNPTVAEGYFQLAMRIAEEMDFRAGALHARLNLAALARETGCPTDGLAHAEAVLATVREHSLRFQEALVLMELAHIRLDLGEVLTAAALADESVTLSRQLGQVTMVGPSLIVRGLVHTKLGEHEQARAAWREAEHVLAGCGSAWHLARVRKLLAS